MLSSRLLIRGKLARGRLQQGWSSWVCGDLMKECEMESGSGVIVGMSEDMCAFGMRTSMSHSYLHIGRHTRVCAKKCRNMSPSLRIQISKSQFMLYRFLPGHHALPVPLPRAVMLTHACPATATCRSDFIQPSR